jgi:chromosome transmission fidelity protein 1
VSLSLIGNPGSEEVELAYQLLNPAPHFREVVDLARSVILAGGTMSPVRKFGSLNSEIKSDCGCIHKISDVVNQLFSHLPREKLASFSCGHIIPSSNLLTLVVGTGPCGGELEYKAGKQGDSAAVRVSTCL